MKLFMTAGLLSLSSFAAFSQNQPRVLKLNSQDEHNVLKGYLYPSFEPGKVFFKDGSGSKALLNFNFLTHEMTFISPQGDTLKLAHPEETPMVTITTDTFCFYGNTFLRKATHYGNMPELYQRMDMKHVDNEKQSAYGYSSISSNTSVGNFSTGSPTITHLDNDQNMVFRQNAEVFIRNGKGEFISVRASSLAKMYPRLKDRIKAFVDENKLSYDNADDMTRLTDYIREAEAAAAPAAGR